MSDGKKYALSYDIQEEIQQQAESADVSAPCEHTDTGRVRCATQYGLYEVERKILVSISENINTMAQAIKDSEQQKHKIRAKCVNFFIGMLVFLTLIATVLIGTDTFFNITVRMEFLVSVILAILADVFAIVHTLVKYITHVEIY